MDVARQGGTICLMDGKQQHLMEAQRARSRRCARSPRRPSLPAGEPGLYLAGSGEPLTVEAEQLKQKMERPLEVKRHSSNDLGWIVRPYKEKQEDQTCFPVP